jgi:hypothetical protein
MTRGESREIIKERVLKELLGKTLFVRELAQRLHKDESNLHKYLNELETEDCLEVKEDLKKKRLCVALKKKGYRKLGVKQKDFIFKEKKMKKKRTKKIKWGNNGTHYENINCDW